MNMEVPVYPQIVGDTAPRTVETAPTAPTPQNVDVLSRLLQLRQGPTLTAEQRERLETMIEELTISQNEAWALAAEIEQGNRGFLEERHGEIRSKGRKLHALHVLGQQETQHVPLKFLSRGFPSSLSPFLGPSSFLWDGMLEPCQGW